MPADAGGCLGCSGDSSGRVSAANAPPLEQKQLQLPGKWSGGSGSWGKGPKQEWEQGGNEVAFYTSRLL